MRRLTRTEQVCTTIAILAIESMLVGVGFTILHDSVMHVSEPSQTFLSPLLAIGVLMILTPSIIVFIFRFLFKGE